MGYLLLMEFVDVPDEVVAKMRVLRFSPRIFANFTIVDDFG